MLTMKRMSASGVLKVGGSINVCLVHAMLLCCVLCVRVCGLIGKPNQTLPVRTYIPDQMIPRRFVTVDWTRWIRVQVPDRDKKDEAGALFKQHQTERQQNSMKSPASQCACCKSVRRPLERSPNNDILFYGR